MTNDFTTRVGGDKWARSGYYRTPGGWVTVNEYAGEALMKFLNRGFQWIGGKYGDVTRYLDVERRQPDPAGIWGPILRHPDGAAEFPTDQIITYRWYRQDVCPVPVKWPQLRGVKILEYQCPQCSRAPFISALNQDGTSATRSDGIMGLGTHLQVIHSWDRLSLMSYGERVGIDFNAVGKAQTVVEYDYEEPEVQEEPDFTVEPAVKDPEWPVCECGYIPRQDSKSPHASLATHQRMHCPLRQKEPVEA